MKPFLTLLFALLLSAPALHATPLDDVKASLAALKAAVADLEAKVNALGQAPAPTPPPGPTPPPPSAGGQVTVNGYVYGVGVPPVDSGADPGGVPQTVNPGNTEYWVACRGDGKAGAGTAGDPFDGSGNKLDGVVNARLAKATFHLAKGAYHTNGLPARANLQYLGAGMGQTVLLGDSGNFVFAWQPTNAIDGFTVSDLTADCSSNGVNHGFLFNGNGSNVLLERIHALHWGFNNAAAECFVCFSFGYPGATQTWSNTVFDRIVFDQPLKSTSGVTIASIFAQKDAGRFDPSCKVTHCVFGPGIAGNFPAYSHACGPVPEMAFCRVYDVQAGYYQEPEMWGNSPIDPQPAYIHDNKFVNVFQGFHLTWTHPHGQEANTVQFVNNLVDNSAGQGAATGYNALATVGLDYAPNTMPNQPAFHVLVISGNTYKGAGKDGDVPIDLSGQGVSANAVTISNNTISYGPGAGAAFRINKARIKSFTASGNTVNGKPSNP